MQPLIETDRLYIRELLQQDEQGMFDMDTDAEVHHYVGQKPLQTMEEVRDVINFVRQQYTDTGIGRWAVLEKGTNNFIGWTGFKLMTEEANGHTGHYDFGYRHTRHAWGKGYATEAARAALQYGVNVLSLWPVYAMTDVNNGASRHILEKLGFQLKEIFTYHGKPSWRTGEDLTATWYELPEEWEGKE